MPFDSPAPDSRFGRLAKDAHEVPTLIARHGPIRPFQILQNCFKTHDGDGLFVTLVTRSGLQQFQSQLLLFDREFLEPNALAGEFLLFVLLRSEVPIHSMRIIKTKGSLLLEFRR